MSYSESQKNALSIGWSGLTKPERRSSEAYVRGAVHYTYTSRRVGDIRTALVELATQENMRPPLQQQEIRLHQRDAEVREHLGAVGIELLAQHEQAVADNRQAMLSLRDEDKRINTQLTAVEGV